MSNTAAAKLAKDSYGLNTTLVQIGNEVDKKAYRNRVLSIWLLAIDSRYDAFRRDLSRGMKGGNFGLDVLTLALTATGSVVAGAADELSAAATGVGGARASLNREVYFEKTLPALVAYMDAERLEIRGQLLQGMNRSIAEYSLEQGFADLWRYQAAGSLDRAISKASDDATNRVSKAQEEYDFSVKTDQCVPSDEVANKRRVLANRLVTETQSADSATRDAAWDRIAMIAAFGGYGDGTVADTDEGKKTQGLQALSYVRDLCTMVSLEDFEAKVFN